MHASHKFKVTLEPIQSLHTHIHNVPRYRSHYNRENRTYFDCDLLLSSIYSEKSILSDATLKNKSP
jgi:hypothetical protein